MDKNKINKTKTMNKALTSQNQGSASTARISVMQAAKTLLRQLLKSMICLTLKICTVKML